MDGAECRARRIALRWTQAELAARAGIGEEAVRRFEAGATGRPRAATLARLRQALEAAPAPEVPAVPADDLARVVRALAACDPVGRRALVEFSEALARRSFDPADETGAGRAA